MREIVLMCGIQGSGKSTLARDFVLQGYLLITEGVPTWEEDFKRAMELNCPKIVVDRVNANVKCRERFLKPARENGYKTKIIYLDVPVEVCVERVSKRENHALGKDTAKQIPNCMLHVLSMFEPPTKNEADELKVISNAS